MLLRREMPVAGWSLDNLLVDQRGVLTLVEAKLTENPEARRQVVGQLMEYAANARAWWGNGRARELAAEYWQRQDRRLDDVLRETFGPERDVEMFWNDVETNLREGE